MEHFGRLMGVAVVNDDVLRPHERMWHAFVRVVSVRTHSYLAFACAVLGLNGAKPGA